MTRPGVRERHIRDLARAALLHATPIKPALKNRDGLVFSFWMLPMPARLRGATATASWPVFLSRPSTTSRHFSNDGWMPATNSGMRRDRGP
jgi:hypothetical protein